MKTPTTIEVSVKLGRRWVADGGVVNWSSDTASRSATISSNDVRHPEDYEEAVYHLRRILRELEAVSRMA